MTAGPMRQCRASARAFHGELGSGSVSDLLEPRRRQQEVDLDASAGQTARRARWHRPAGRSATRIEPAGGSEVGVIAPGRRREEFHTVVDRPPDPR